MTIHSRRLPVGSPFVFVHRIAKAITKEGHSAGVLHDTILRTRVAAALSERPELVDWPLLSTWMVKAYHSSTNAALNKAPDLYIPTLYVRIGKGLSVEMQQMTLPHIDLLDDTTRAVKTRFNATIDRKLETFAGWRTDLAHHPEMPTLGDVQRDLRGYVDRGEPDIPDEPNGEDDDE
jgi:hypothetical protein